MLIAMHPLVGERVLVKSWIGGTAKNAPTLGTITRVRVLVIGKCTLYEQRNITGIEAKLDNGELITTHSNNVELQTDTHETPENAK